MNADTLISTAIQHKAAFVVAFGWAVREMHNLWPIIRPSSSIPLLQQYGGLRGIAMTILTGSKPGNAAVPQIPKIETYSETKP